MIDTYMVTFLAGIQTCPLGPSPLGSNGPLGPALWARVALWALALWAQMALWALALWARVAFWALTFLSTHIRIAAVLWY